MNAFLADHVKMLVLVLSTTSTYRLPCTIGEGGPGVNRYGWCCSSSSRVNRYSDVAIRLEGVMLLFISRRY